MTEQEWLTSTDPRAMLYWMTLDQTSPGWRRVSDRKLRLFAAACYWNVLPVVNRLSIDLLQHIVKTEQWAETGTKPEDYQSNPDDLHDIATDHAASAARWAGYHRGTRTDKQLDLFQANLLRSIVGNPWRPVKLNQRWLTPTVKSLAKAAYEQRPGWVCEKCKSTGRVKTFGPYGYDCSWEPCEACHGTGRIEDGTLDSNRLAVLADALFDAGMPAEIECENCNNGWVALHEYRERVGEMCGVGQKLCPHCGGTGSVPNPILTHLRSEGPHVRGCWVLDLLIGKE